MDNKVKLTQLQLMKMKNKLLSDIVEFQKEFNEPYFIFVPMDEIANPTSYFNFIIYELGKNRIILWGIYDKKTKNIHVDNGCVYGIMKIANYHKLMMTKFILVNSVVKNRISNLVKQFSGIVKYPRNYHEYRMFKAYLQYLNTKDETILKLMEEEDDAFRNNMDMNDLRNNSEYNIKAYVIPDSHSGDFDEMEFIRGGQYVLKTIKNVPPIFEILKRYRTKNQLERDVNNYEKDINISTIEFKNNEELNIFIEDMYEYLSKHNLYDKYNEKCPEELFKDKDFFIDDFEDSYFESNLPHKYELDQDYEMEDLI